MNILIGLLISVGWVAIMYFSSNIAQLGRVDRAEKNLWSTRAMYALLWFVFLVLGLMILFWFVDMRSSNSYPDSFGDTSAIG